MQEVKKISRNGNILEAILYFDKDSKYFAGHFLEIPVLPGFIQVDFAIKIAKEQFGINPTISNIKKLKFTKIITPNKNINLQLEYLEDSQSLSFKYYDKNDTFSSGKYYFK